MLLCGDAEYVVDLSQDLVTCLLEASLLNGVDRDSSVNEFKSLVVDLRQSSSALLRSTMCLIIITS